jgi:hypothetical protein
MAMGVVSSRGGSWEVAKLTGITQLKMEDACILYSIIIEFFFMKKINKDRKRRPFSLLKLQISFTQLCKNTSTSLWRSSKYLREELISGVLVVVALFFCLSYIRGNKSLSCASWEINPHMLDRQ